MNHTPEMDPNYQNFGPASNQHYLHNQDVYQHKCPEATPQPYMWSFTSPIYYSFIIIALAPICNNYVIILPIMIYFDLLLCLFYKTKKTGNKKEWQPAMVAILFVICF